MRVLHVVTADQARGAERVARAIADNAVAGDVHRLVAVRRSPRAFGTVAVDGTLTRSSRRAAVLTAAVRLRREVRRWRPDVVVGHGGAATLVAAMGSGAAPVVWHRILELPGGVHGPRSWPWRLLLTRCAAVIALTARTEREVRRLGYAGPVWRIPNHRPAATFASIDRGGAGADLRRELGIAGEAPILGFVGHLVEQKDPLAFVDVATHVLGALPEARAVIAGDGPLRAAVEDAVGRSPHGGRIHVLGHRTDATTVVAACDVLAVTSTTESMTGVVIEAQMVGTPVVSHDLDGIDDALEHDVTGVIVPGRDEMVFAVERLLRDRARLDAMGATAAARSRRFATEAVAARYRAAFAWTHRDSDVVRPRVLHVVPNIGVGGAERALLLIARHASRSGMSAAVAGVMPPRVAEAQTVLPELRSLGCPAGDLGVSGRPSRSPVALARAAWRLRRLVARLDPDVVDTALFDADVVARLALVGTRRLHVTHLVNSPYAPEVRRATAPRPWRFFAVRELDSWSARRTDAFVALTDAVAAGAIRDLRLPPERLRVISRGVDTDEFAPGSAGPPPPLHVVSVGRLVLQKDHSNTIAAVGAARAAGADVRLTILGEGPLHDRLEREIDTSRARGAVTLAGPATDVATRLRSQHVFVQSSPWEGQSNAVIEAMATGLAVVVTDIPPFREVVGDAGILVPVADPDALARVLVELATGGVDRLTSLGQRARQRAAARYSAVTRVGELADLYRELLAR